MKARWQSLAAPLLALVVFVWCLTAVLRPGWSSSGAGLQRPSGSVLAVGVRDVVVREPVLGVYVLPREEVAISAAENPPGIEVRLRAEAGTVTPSGTGQWTWHAPPEPGLYPITVEALPDGPAILLHAFVTVPFDRVRNGRLNGYRIGVYPGNRADRPPPGGFVEVTPRNEAVLVSPRFRLGQFVSKQGDSYPKYLVLDERLLQKLERVVDGLRRRGVRADTLHVMSGYRTPYRNALLGNVRLSLHQWGRAADIFVDANGDGLLDDLNGDGRVDIEDARLLAEVIDDLDEVGGGMGIYPATAAHGPFVHVDVRPRRARWGSG